MNVAGNTLENFDAVIEGQQALLAAHSPPWLQGQHEAGAQAFARLGLPTRRQEDWRYTSLSPLLARHFVPTGPETGRMTAAQVAALWLQKDAAYRLVFVNGHLAPTWSDLDAIPAPVVICGLRQAIERWPAQVAARLGSVARTDAHAFSALNTALIDDGVFISVPASVQLDRPIEVLHVAAGSDEPVLAQPRNLIAIESGAEATLIERYASSDDTVSFANGLSEIFMAPRARLTHVRLQDENSHACHLHSLNISAAAGSDYRNMNIALGGAWARTEMNVALDGEGAHVDLSGLYVTGDQQLHDFHVKVAHRAPGGVSATHYKGLLHGKGRAVFDGHIGVQRAAQKTDAHLVNANLLLSRDAEVDTKPQLEIYADDVKCSHGTTVGQLEPEQLFYLRSRGIDPVQAQRMLCLGFADEILQRCEPAGLRDVVVSALNRRLVSVASDAQSVQPGRVQ